MRPTPVTLGLTLCDYVIVEDRTRKVSTIGNFSGLKLHQFPSVPQPFCAIATLTHSAGTGIIELVITDIDGTEEIYKFQQDVRLADRFADTIALFRIKNCSFPASGLYLITLLVDGESVAQRRLHVYSEDESI